MEITISLKDLGILLIGAGLIVLIFYGISLVRNLIYSVKLTNKILEDSQSITAIASERAKEINTVAGDVVSSIGSITEAIKGNQSTIKALTSIVNSFGALKSLLKNKK